MKAGLCQSLTLSLTFAMLFATFPAAQERGISIAENIVMNVYSNGILDDNEFAYWELRGFFPRGDSKPWLTLYDIRIDSLNGSCRLYPKLFNLANLSRPDSTSYNIALCANRGSDTLYVSISYVGNIGPMMNKIKVNSAAFGGTGFPKKSFVPDTSSTERHVPPLRNVYLEYFDGKTKHH